MKKTLVSLALVACAVTACPIMAWEPTGTGGVVNFSGSLESKISSPWEVKTGEGGRGLDAIISEGMTEVDIPVNKAIPVLSIRVNNSEFFKSSDVTGLLPQISYGDSIVLGDFKNSTTPVTLEVKDSKGDRIGKMTVELLAYAESLYKVPGEGSYNRKLVGDDRNAAFFGGLPKTASAVDEKSGRARIFTVDRELYEHYPAWKQPVYQLPTGPEDFLDGGDTRRIYSAFYGAGIEEHKSIHITLDSPVRSGERIEWTASLPVIVSYT
jgi:hypothetical protein